MMLYVLLLVVVLHNNPLKAFPFSRKFVVSECLSCRPSFELNSDVQPPHKRFIVKPANPSRRVSTSGSRSYFDSRSDFKKSPALGADPFDTQSVEDETLGLQNKPFKSGFVSIIGNPNVGKSTLMNGLFLWCF